MAKAIHHPHDSIFKTCMGHLKVARSMIQQFMPQNLQEILKLDTLQVCNTNFVSADLSQRYADMLYRVDIVDDDSKACIYLLWESQSTYQKLMPVRMVEYCCSIMREEAKQNSEVAPLVIPFLVYNGEKSPYPGATDILSTLKIKNKAAAKQFFHNPFILVDLTVIKDEKLLSNVWAACPNMLLKHMRCANFLPILSMMLKPLQALHEKGETILVEMVITTVVRSTNIPDENELIKLTNEVSNELGENMRTAAQAWLEEGYNKGINQGISQGINQGISQGINQGISQGINKGIHIGREEMKKEMAASAEAWKDKCKHTIKKLAKRGMAINEISECVGMSIVDIEKMLSASSPVEE